MWGLLQLTQPEPLLVCSLWMTEAQKLLSLRVCEDKAAECCETLCTCLIRSKKRSTAFCYVEYHGMLYVSGMFAHVSPFSWCYYHTVSVWVWLMLVCLGGIYIVHWALVMDVVLQWGASEEDCKMFMVLKLQVSFKYFWLNFLKDF